MENMIPREELTGEERQLLFDIFNDYLIRHTTMARFEAALAGIKPEELDWHLKHAEFARSTFAKVGFSISEPVPSRVSAIQRPG